MDIVFALVLGSPLLVWGMRLGRRLVRSGVTANDVFKGKTPIALAFLGFYIGLLLLALNLPQLPILPLEWRFHGMRVTWLLLRVMLMGACGIGFAVSWQTARAQVFAVGLVGLLGFGAFTSAEGYFLAPIYSELQDNLRPNGVFRQTSNSSCAPAALATVLRRWGINATESSVARLAGTTRLGTSMPQLIMAARALGMDGLELTPTWEQIQQINRPGVLAVWLLDGNRKLPHAVALLAMNSDVAAIADPARGRIYNLDRSTFAKIWRQQYVPFYRSEEVALSQPQIANYLHQMGYLKAPQVNEANEGLRHFQRAQGLKMTGKLDPKTALLLSGPFLEKAPRLETNKKMPVTN